MIIAKFEEFLGSRRSVQGWKSGGENGNTLRSNLKLTEIGTVISQRQFKNFTSNGEL